MDILNLTEMCVCVYTITFLLLSSIANEKKASRKKENQDEIAWTHRRHILMGIIEKKTIIRSFFLFQSFAN